MAENAYKMAEENQIMKEPQEITKELQRVTTKDPKKVEAGKRLAESNRKKREAKKREEQAKLEKSRVNQYYGIGAVLAPLGPRPLYGLLALGVIGSLSYYIYRTKKVEQPSKPQQSNPKPHPQMQPQTNKFEMN